FIELKDVNELNYFKRIRLKEAKRNFSGVLVKKRVDNLFNALEQLNPSFPYLNDTEKLDYMIYHAERCMAASGWYPGLRTADEIEEEKMKLAFDKIKKEKEDK